MERRRYKKSLIFDVIYEREKLIVKGKKTNLLGGKNDQKTVNYRF